MLTPLQVVKPTSRTIPTVTINRFTGQSYVRPMSEAELIAFLSEVTGEEDDRVTDLWDKHSGLKGLLDAEIETSVKQQAHSRKRFIYDPIAHRYRYVDSGYLVSEVNVKNGILRVSNAVREELKTLTAQMVSDQISVERWYREMTRTLKDEYRAAWIASIGGKQMYDRRQAALFGRAAAPQYRWLADFMDGLQTGRIKKDGRAVYRARMYARAGNLVYEESRRLQAKMNGYRFAMRVLGATDYHCHDAGNKSGCVELAALGWVEIDSIVPIGSAVCMSNCLCRYKFRKRLP